MSKSKREKVYDEQIYPLMNKIMDIVKEHDIPLHATFLLGNGDACTTHLEGTDTSWLMRAFYYLSQSRGNFDTFMIAIQRDADKYGHSSIFLKVLNFKEENKK